MGCFTSNEDQERRADFRNAVYLIRGSNYYDSKGIFQSIKEKFVKANEYQYSILCNLLMSECALYLGREEQFEIRYQEARESAREHGVQWGGPLIAESQYKIGIFRIWDQDQETAKSGFDHNLRIAYQEFASYMNPIRLIIRINKFEDLWYIYSSYFGIDEPQLKPNLYIDKFQHSNKGLCNHDCRNLSKMSWPNVTEINLSQNRLGPQECFYLKKANWPSLKIISLEKNKIGSEGCQHLSQANWPNLTIIHIHRNNIDDLGCLHLSRAKWPNLFKITLKDNNITGKGCYYLSKAHWLKLQVISLISNRIDAEGCSHLSKTYWPNLKVIGLHQNDEITEAGSTYFCKSQWPNIQKIHLSRSTISDSGITTLMKCYPDQQSLILK